jgi:hypothetical protein
MTTARLDYCWNLRNVMADHQMFATTDLIDPLAQRGIRCLRARSTGWSPNGPNGSA